MRSVSHFMKVIISVSAVVGLLPALVSASESATNPFPAMSVVIGKHTCAKRFPDLKTRLDAAFQHFAETNTRHLSTGKWKEMEKSLGPIEEHSTTLTRDICEHYLAMLLTSEFDDMQNLVDAETARAIEAQRLLDAAEGHLSGIGIVLEEDQIAPTVRSVQPDSPGARAGVTQGDVIVEFNGQKVAVRSDLHVKVLRTPPGTTVMLTVSRKGARLKVPVTVATLGEK